MTKYTPQAEICRFSNCKICCVKYLVLIYIYIRTLTVQNQDETFKHFEFNLFSFESVLSSDNTDLDKNLFNDKIQQIDSPYFSVGNIRQLNKDNFCILHLNIRSLNANIDNYSEFLGSLNGNFIVIVLTESL